MPLQPVIKEDFLHYLWKTKKIGGDLLHCTDGRKIKLLDYGTYNTDSGPDFFNGRIELDGNIWAGNIEMHVYSSDWIKHEHHQDHAYDNVILHVVYEHDSLDEALNNIPTLELKGRIPRIYLDHYLSLMQSQDSIPCSRMLPTVDKQKIELWKYTLVVERLLQKTAHLAEIHKATGDNWEETFYIMLARYFGAKVNTQPFELLAKSLPLSILLKNADKPQAIEALIFGQAGMLDADYQDEYYQIIKKEYTYLRQKYGLTPINAVMWKFSKMRPGNFPTIRLAQFAALLTSNDRLFSKIKEASSAKTIRELLHAKPNEYWNTHYRFGTLSTYQLKNISDEMMDLLLINAIVPVLYLYGKSIGDEIYTDKAISLLESVKAEKNSIINEWKSMHQTVKSAFDSQAFIHLKQNYCSYFRCMECRIGHEIMNR